HGPDLYRRSLYVFRRRTVGPPNLFDTADRQVCSVRPTRTNTPIHALVLLNDPTYVEASRALAERVLTKGGTGEDERIVYLFRLATSRRPTDQERSVLAGALERLRTQYGADRAAAAKLLAVGESKRNESLDVVEHAAWAGLASLVLNLDEVVSKE